MAGPSIFVGTASGRQAAADALERAFVQHGVTRDADNTWVGTAFGAPLPRLAPIVAEVSAKPIGPLQEQFRTIVELGAMVNQTPDHAALFSLALATAFELSGRVIFEVPSQGLSSQEVALTPEEALAWWHSSDKRLVK